MTVTPLPSFSAILPLRVRAIRSVEPPGGKGTTRVMGLLGQVSAQTRVLPVRGEGDCGLQKGSTLHGGVSPWIQFKMSLGSHKENAGT